MRDNPPPGDDRCPPSLGDALRHATRHSHQDVEGRLDLLAPSLTPTRYLRHLETLHAFIEGWESVPGMQPPSLGWGSPLWRARVLEREIESLSSRLAIARRALQPVDLSDTLGRWPDAAGAHYVLEGSALGARHIDAHLESHFAWYGPDHDGYFRHLASVAAERWRRFRAFLGDVSPAHHDRIVAAAVTTFAALAGHLQRTVVASSDESATR